MDRIRNLLLTLAIVAAAFMSVLYCAAVRAHDTSQTVNIDNSTHYYGNNGGNGMGEIESDLERDVAAAVATAASMSFCNFDYSPGLQGCVGTATYDDEWAMNFQLGKRVDTLLLTGGFACDDEFDECAAGGAVSFRF